MPRRKEKKLGDWRDDAECLKIDKPVAERVNGFYPERSHAEAAKAKAVCKTCPVREACLAEAIANNEKFGIWGGMDTLERTKMARKQRNARSIDD